MKTISKANNYLETDFLKYARAILTQEDYVNKFKVNGFIDYVFDDNTSELAMQEMLQEENKPIFNPKRHSEYSPELSEIEVRSLEDPDLFTKEELVEILNTVILKYINWEDLSNERPDRHSTDTTSISDTQL